MDSQNAVTASWASPITAEHVAAGARPVSRARFAGPPGATRVYYSQRIPTEASRIGIFANDSGVAEDAVSVLPAPYSAHSRVHEYGGGAWAVAADHTITFVNAADQRLYRFNPVTDPGTPPVALTPETDRAVRYGDLDYSAGRLLAVRESYDAAGTVTRAIVEVAEGTTAAEPGGAAEPDAAADQGRASAPEAVRELAAGPHFLAFPRISPDHGFLSFIGWDHPDMPWDQTKLYLVAHPGTAGASAPVAVFGRADESVLQPEWLSNTTLSVIADRSGRWQLYSLSAPAFFQVASGGFAAEPAEESELLVTEGEIGGPLWNLGARWYLPVQGGNRILAESRFGTSQMVWTDGAGTDDVLECDLETFSLQDYRDGLALVIGGSADRITGLYLYDVTVGSAQALALSLELPVPASYLPQGHAVEIDGVHAIVYPPHNPDHPQPGAGPAAGAAAGGNAEPAAEGTAGSAAAPAPFVAFVHGGPTSQSVPQVSLHHAYFTSRGIGVVDVNYSGSTGYGRAYRDALRGHWGFADVADTVTVLQGLARQGTADADRLAISGGSAGGWTVLQALTRTDVFACGSDYYGVAELSKFITETHDFESQYIWRLIGVDPQAPDREERLADLAPLHHLADLDVPVAIFQGEQDPIVPPSQAHRLISGLQDKGQVYVAEFYPNESHGFTRVENIADSLRSELGFYCRIMGLDAPDVPPVHLRGRGRS